MQRALKLNLSSPIYLESTKLSLDGLISRSSSMEKGYEATVLFRIECDNESITLSQLGAGERNGYTEEEKQKIENGEMPEKKESEDFLIPSGMYLFEQLPFLPDEKDLPRILLPYISKEDMRVYVRIYKENVLETVMQLLFPIE